MTRIGNVDQILLLLREQLQRTDKRRGAQKPATGRTQTAAARPLERARALAALESLSEEEKRKAVVRGLLTEEFGEAIGNDATLQSIVDDVVRIIGETPGGPELIDRAFAQLREAQA